MGSRMRPLRDHRWTCAPFSPPSFGLSHLVLFYLASLTLLASISTLVSPAGPNTSFGGIAPVAIGSIALGSSTTAAGGGTDATDELSLKSASSPDAIFTRLINQSREDPKFGTWSVSISLHFKDIAKSDRCIIPYTEYGGATMIARSWRPQSPNLPFGHFGNMQSGPGKPIDISPVLTLVVVGAAYILTFAEI